MGHGTFIFAGEFTLLYEWDGDWSGPPSEYVAKGWMDDNEVFEWFWHEDGMIPDMSAVERDYAHIGKDCSVFYHAGPGPGRFKVTHIEYRAVSEMAERRAP
jgi:hypothetical protein